MEADFHHLADRIGDPSRPPSILANCFGRRPRGVSCKLIALAEGAPRPEPAKTRRRLCPSVGTPPAPTRSYP